MMLPARLYGPRVNGSRHMRFLRPHDTQIACRPIGKRSLNPCPNLRDEAGASVVIEPRRRLIAPVIDRGTMASCRTWSCTILCGFVAVVLSSAIASAADLVTPPPIGRFLATCENLGRFCYADACGRDQIDAAAGCQAQCPSSVVISVVPTACSLARPPAGIVLRRRG